MSTQDCEHTKETQDQNRIAQRLSQTDGMFENERTFASFAEKADDGQQTTLIVTTNDVFLLVLEIAFHSLVTHALSYNEIFTAVTKFDDCL